MRRRLREFYEKAHEKAHVKALYIAQTERLSVDRRGDPSTMADAMVAHNGDQK